MRNVVEIDGFRYIILNKAFIEEDCYVLIDRIDDNNNPLKQFQFARYYKNDEKYQLEEDEDFVSVLASVFYPYYN